MVVTRSFIKILVLFNLLSIGRYFNHSFITTFAREMIENLNFTTKEVAELLEWCLWPNMILSVICGFLMDNLLGLKTSLVVFSFISIFGYLLFITGMYLTSFWLCAASQLLLGIGYETIFIIQLAFLGRNFIYGRIYTMIGILFCSSFAAIFIGKLSLPAIYKGMNSNLVNTSAVLLIPHLVSMGSVIWLICLRELDSSNPKESYVLHKRYKLKLFLIFAIFMFYYTPNLQFWADYKEPLRWKYEYHDSIIWLFYAATSLSMLILGLFLDMTSYKVMYLLWGLAILCVAHCFLVFTFINPWFIVTIISISHAIAKLVIWVFLLSIVPKNEFATAMGFLQSFENLSFAMSSHLKPMVMDSCGLFIQGITNVFCMLMAYACAVVLWYAK